MHTTNQHARTHARTHARRLVLQVLNALPLPWTVSIAQLGPSRGRQAVSLGVVVIPTLTYHPTNPITHPA